MPNSGRAFRSRCVSQKNCSFHLDAKTSAVIPFTVNQVAGYSTSYHKKFHSIYANFNRESNFTFHTTKESEVATCHTLDTQRTTTSRIQLHQIHSVISSKLVNISYSIRHRGRPFTDRSISVFNALLSCLRAKRMLINTSLRRQFDDVIFGTERTMEPSRSVERQKQSARRHDYMT